ncbi:STAS/SEC14 domain-containing protein [Mycobacterium barrassiae]|uniref:STAS/SEC14 domain-containing protein n=1 Tax=Mycobacterium barrassiae TaxID=319709 RepID=UPI002265A54C|nr:STAS/SEC14 domain-containing protein [Mycobacterium barrassiae]MCV7299982.1 STAS/SEC14 domain-containing protein [Mycobacterium barrassiae]
MIEVLQDMPAGVAGIRISGKVTGDDISAFMPELEKLFESGELRFVEVIASDYEGFGRGGLVEDLKQSFGTLIKHHGGFKRTAVVTDKEWVTHTVHALGWLVPGDVEVFGLDELEKAKQWAAG